MCINQTITAPLQSEQVLQANQSATVAPTSPPAKLVRGFTGTGRDDFDAQAALVASALPGWQDVDPATITVEDKSGYGGSRTFKVTAAAAQPPAVALHSRNMVEETTHKTDGGCVDHASEERQEAAATAFAKADCAPRRLAQGGDWFIECWEGEQPWNSREGKWDSLTDDELRDAARLLAKVHTSVPIGWFETHRDKIKQRNKSFEGCPQGSHAWLTASRLHWFEGDENSDPEHVAKAVQFYMNAGCDSETASSMHPLAARIVTCHGDFHPSNYILRSNGLVCVDLEFACVSSAVTDLAYCNMWLHGAAKRTVFLTAYMNACGTTPTAAEVDALRFDCEAAFLRVFHPAKLWADFHKTKNETNYWFDCYRMYEAVECQVRQCPILREEALESGLLKCPAVLAVEHQVAMQAIQKSEWHNSEQRALEEDCNSMAALSSCTDELAALKGSEFNIRILDDLDLVLQVRPDSSMVELAAFTPDDAQQQWYQVGDSLVHAASGWVLDTEVQYVVNARGEPWESSTTRLCVREQDSSDRQRWCLESVGADCCRTEGVIRHIVDGRVLTVNSWTAQNGQGVHVGVECKAGHTQRWQMDGIQEHAVAAQTAVAPGSNASGDIEYIIKCSYPTDEASDDAPVHNTEFCMQVFNQQVKCGRIDGSADQRWKLSEQNGLLQITNVGNGECLHTETKYITIHNASHVWDHNQTDLVTKPADSSEQQKWLFGFGGPQKERWGHKHSVAVEAWGDGDVTLSAGKCLRHFKDGRVVDVHGWSFKHEGKMGCENSCHGVNKGTSWVLVDAASYTNQ